MKTTDMHSWIAVHLTCIAACLTVGFISIYEEVTDHMQITCSPIWSSPNVYSMYGLLPTLAKVYK